MASISRKKATSLIVLALALLVLLAVSLAVFLGQGERLQPAMPPQADAGQADDHAAADWIELRNESGEALDLSGYRLSDYEWIIPDGTVIGPGEVVTLKGASIAWIELRNESGETLDLSGYRLPDCEWTIPDGTVIGPGEGITFQG